MAPNDDREQTQTSQTAADDTDTSLAPIEEQADRSIRRLFHDDRWFFSVIEVIGVLTDAPRPRMYWADMKRRIQNEGFHELLAKCQQLKMRSADGKYYRTDATDTETLLRIIQSVPSPKAEPVKQWLARIGAQRLDEATQPLSAADVRHAIAALPIPAEDGPALALAEYYARLSALYRRQAAYETQLAYVDARLAEHGEQIGELHDRLESVEEVTRLVPEVLERLGPQTLTPAHQATLKAMVKRLHDLTGAAYPTIYTDLGERFHIAKYDDIPDARWAEVAAWFQTRIAAGEKRRMG